MPYRQDMPVEEKRQRGREAMARYRKNSPEKAAAASARSKAKPESKAKHAALMRRHRAEDPEKAAGIQRKADLKRRKGDLLTPDEYDAMLEAQGYCCGICRRHQTEFPRRLAVDHCHATGKIRGLLCMRCNTGLGKLGDTFESVSAALEYLRLAEGK